MNIKARKTESVTVLDLEGLLTLPQNTRKLHFHLDLLLRENHRYFVLNMQDVHLMDCAGIGELVLAYRRVLERGGDLKLLNLSRRLHNLLKMMGLLTIIEVFENEQDAVSSFGVRAALAAERAVSNEMPDRKGLLDTLSASSQSPSHPFQATV